jgi:hypothetical protein
MGGGLTRRSPAGKATPTARYENRNNSNANGGVLQVAADHKMSDANH